MCVCVRACVSRVCGVWGTSGRGHEEGWLSGMKQHRLDMAEVFGKWLLRGAATKMVYQHSGGLACVGAALGLIA